MSTKTITISIEDAQAGDLFSGEYIKSEGIKSVVTNVPLVSYAGRNLYPKDGGYLPFIGTTHTGEYVWRNVHITREVPVQSRLERLLELPIGTVFRAGPNNYFGVKVSATSYIAQHGFMEKPTFYPIEAHTIGTQDDDLIIIPDPQEEHK
jgi:hypothetical protein